MKNFLYFTFLVIALIACNKIEHLHPQKPDAQSGEVSLSEAKIAFKHYIESSNAQGSVKLGVGDSFILNPKWESALTENLQNDDRALTVILDPTVAGYPRIVTTKLGTIHGLEGEALEAICLHKIMFTKIEGVVKVEFVSIVSEVGDNNNSYRNFNGAMIFWDSQGVLTRGCHFENGQVVKSFSSAKTASNARLRG